jgi:DNA polymerase-1
MQTLTIVDTFGFFFRAYYALPPLRNSEGFPTGLLTGFVNMIHQLEKEHATDYLVFALDSKGPTFRNERYPEYKAHRPPPPEELVQQLPVAIAWIEKMGFANVSVEGFEADDVIATITRCAVEAGIKVKIISHDKDLYQLIDDDRVVIVDAIKKKEINEKGCIEKFEVHPRDFVDFQAIVGDSADNVPGVKGIGQKGAAKLINRFHTLEAIYEHIDEAGTPRIQNLLLSAKESAFLSRELVRLRNDVFDTCDLERYRLEEREYLAPLREEFERYEMRRALRLIERAERGGTSARSASEPSSEPTAAEPAFEAIVLDTPQKLEAVLATITPETVVAFDTETTGLDTRTDTMVGFSFAIDEARAYYVPIAHNYLGVGDQIERSVALEAIVRLMRSRVVGQNLKFDLGLLYRMGLEEITPHADTMIMAWLLDPGSKVGLDALAHKMFGYTMRSFKETVKKGENFASVPIEEATFYAAEDAWMTLRLFHALSHLFTLADPRIAEEAREVEYPFINVLIRMEAQGIKVDTDYLHRIRTEMSRRLDALTRTIYDEAGTEFNIRSTQQLGAVLFQQLGLKGGKKTKTGYSTNEAVLQKLRDAHPIISHILEYREYQKMLSTYVEPLMKLAQNDPGHRVYTHFLQTGTATGRLSSRDPNLQNIPVRSELGRSVRRAFVAEEGFRLISIDYSQIELRLLAHFSGDAALREAFAHGHDIHLATAIKLFGEADAPAKRAIAKSINFGLLYGMGSRKLADELGISTAEAKEIIQAYFATFPTVKRYLEQIQDDAKHHGYVETLLGRRRVFDYDNAGGMQKAAILREAVNTVFQGSAADLIKLAMLTIDRTVRAENWPVRMLLQIHDELIFEAPQEEAEAVAKRLQAIMEGVYRLEVALECSVSIDTSWDKLK